MDQGDRRDDQSYLDPSDLQTYTIYRHPLDYPQGYAMSQFAIAVDGPKLMSTAYVDTLEQARALIPEGLIRFLRSPEDHPSVVETWM